MFITYLLNSTLWRLHTLYQEFDKKFLRSNTYNYADPEQVSFLRISLIKDLALKEIELCSEKMLNGEIPEGENDDTSMCNEMAGVANGEGINADEDKIYKIVEREIGRNNNWILC